MLAKWAIAVFLSFSALLARDVRAVDLSGAPESLALPIANGSKEISVKDSSSIDYSGVIEPVSSRIKAQVTARSYLLQKNPAAVQTMVTAMMKDSFLSAFTKVVDDCRLPKIKRIEIGTSTYATSDALTLDSSIKDISKYLYERAKNCDEAYKSFDRLSARLSPDIAVSIDSSDLLTGRFKHAAVTAVADELVSPKFREVFDSFQANCRFTVKSIRLRSYLAAYEREGEVTLPINEKPHVTRAHFKNTAADCAGFVGQLVSFNQEVSLKKGLLFRFDMERLLQRRIQGSEIAKWIDFYASNPEKLEDLRQAALDVSSDSQYRDLKQCLASKKRRSSKKGCSSLMQVEFTTRTEIRPASGGLLSSLLLIDLVFSPFYIYAGIVSPTEMTKGLGVKYETILNTPVRINAAEEPRVPDFVHALN